MSKSSLKQNMRFNQLEHTSPINKCIQLINNKLWEVKDKANKKSFFGVELRINEKTKNSLLQYNPPQLLDFDEEDSFNKLIYREYIDYGEGYNTSIDWGKSKDNLTFISSHFLPSQETPTVDFKPSKIDVVTSLSV